MCFQTKKILIKEDLGDFSFFQVLSLQMWGVISVIVVLF